ncbi:MAG: hypothetical protein RLP09_47730 [Sandaracinaceae bacterium]
MHAVRALLLRLYRKPKLRLAPQGGAWLANTLHTGFRDALDTQRLPALRPCPAATDPA